MGKVKDTVRNITAKMKKNNEVSARKTVLEELFYDFNRSRAEVYKMNFFRGIFFGFGSVLGGTIVVALLLALLTLLVDVPGGVGDFIQYVIDTVRRTD
jgi:hypothetical protein